MAAPQAEQSGDCVLDVHGCILCSIVIVPGSPSSTAAGFSKQSGEREIEPCIDSFVLSSSSTPSLRTHYSLLRPKWRKRRSILGYPFIRNVSSSVSSRVVIIVFLHPTTQARTSKSSRNTSHTPPQTLPSGLFLPPGPARLGASSARLSERGQVHLLLGSGSCWAQDRS